MLRLHETYRYPKPASHAIAESGSAYPNFFAATEWPTWSGLLGAHRAQLEKGIDAIAVVQAVDGLRRPAIMIGINPHKAGSDWTPWHDEIDPRNDFVRYYGDNKPGLSLDPELTAGNRALLSQQPLHQATSDVDRMRAGPLLVFENVIQLGRSKGYRRFRGLALLDRVERVVQIDRHGTPFVNFRFDCDLVTLAAENNYLDWNWIAARRDPSKTLSEACGLAPKAWQQWISKGWTEPIRQRLLTYRIVSEKGQRPDPGSPADLALKEVLDHYAGQKQRFEALAELITRSVLGARGSYHMGWLTRGSGDRGIDFVGRLDLGTGGEPLRVVVVGQAKCELGASGVNELSRLASKLNRGWVGVFVTTGYFSTPAQRELQDDGFPILLIHGRGVGEAVLSESTRLGLHVPSYLAMVDTSYEQRVKPREPSEVLNDE